MEIKEFCALACAEHPEHRACIEAWRKWYLAQHALAGEGWAPLTRDPVVWRSQLLNWELSNSSSRTLH
jgi:hypothetical protein